MNSDFVLAHETSGPGTVDGSPGPNLLTAVIVCALTLCVLVWLAIAQPVQAQLPRSAIATARPKSTAPPVPCPARGVTIDGRVVRVIDGDTIVISSEVQYHVRLLDCWAPESRTLNTAEKQRGIASKSRMQSLAADKQVRVNMPTTGDLTEMITMGRVLGRVWLLADGVPADADLSTIMVREKLATATKTPKDAP